MPEPVPILVALIVAGLAAAGIRLTSTPNRTVTGGVLAAGLGLLIGCLMLGLRPVWPIREDLDRLLLILLPSVMVVELLAALPGTLAPGLAARAATGLVWVLRGAVAASAAYVVLHHTAYVADLSGPGSRLWSPTETAVTLGCLAAGLAAVWLVLGLVAGTTAARSAPLALAVAATGGAVTVMLSGVAANGQLGLALAAALIAAALMPDAGAVRGMIGVGTVSLFGLVVIGRYGGELTNPHALLIFFAPVLSAVPELPYLCRLWPWVRTVLAMALTAVPVALALQAAYLKEPPPPPARPEEPVEMPSTPADPALPSLPAMPSLPG